MNEENEKSINRSQRRMFSIIFNLLISMLLIMGSVHIVMWLFDGRYNVILTIIFKVNLSLLFLLMLIFVCIDVKRKWGSQNDGR